MLNKIVLNEFDITSIVNLNNEEINIISKRSCGISYYTIKSQFDIEYELRICKNILINKNKNNNNNNNNNK